jgi:hypothetical protein
VVGADQARLAAAAAAAAAAATAGQIFYVSNAEVAARVVAHAVHGKKFAAHTQRGDATLWFRAEQQVPAIARGQGRASVDPH